MAEYNITGVKKALKSMVFELDIDFPPPPLTLLLNPSNLEFKLTPKIQETRVRWIDRRDSGFLMQTAHDDLDSISVECRTAQFYDNGGLTAKNATKSLAYENFAQLLAIYRNNGMNHVRTGTTQGASLIQSVGKVNIYYDGTVYKGYFESFTTTASQDTPFSIAFTFEFKVIENYTNSGLSSPTSRLILVK